MLELVLSVFIFSIGMQYLIMGWVFKVVVLWWIWFIVVQWLYLIDKFRCGEEIGRKVDLVFVV